MKTPPLSFIDPTLSRNNSSKLEPFFCSGQPAPPCNIFVNALPETTSGASEQMPLNYLNETPTQIYNPNSQNVMTHYAQTPPYTSETQQHMAPSMAQSSFEAPEHFPSTSYPPQNQHIQIAPEINIFRKKFLPKVNYPPIKKENKNHFPSMSKTVEIINILNNSPERSNKSIAMMCQTSTK